MSKADITYKGIDLTVSYDYEPAEKQTWEEPGCDESYDIYEVFHNGEDISDIISEDIREELTTALAEACRNPYDNY